VKSTSIGMPKTSRRPGEKPKRRAKTRPLSPFSDPRVPTGHSNLTAFLLSCDTSTTVEEAVREYQNEWCEHPRKLRVLISTVTAPSEERYEYTVACAECGRHKMYQGRPSNELKRTRVFQ
jgi:hypothetical protein